MIQTDVHTTTLEVVVTGGRQLGRCYHETTYLVKCRWKLKHDKLTALREAGFLGYGQEFMITSPCDGFENEQPDGLYHYTATSRVDSSD
jgi:hypothetical protein